MKQLIKPRQALAAIVLAMTLGGCTQISQPVYEERIRIFYAVQPGDQIMPGDSPEVIGRKFMPMAAVNSSLSLLTRDGFTLKTIRPLPTSDGATMFVFERPLPTGYYASRAPMEFTGLYRTTDGAGDEWRLVFVPHRRGFTIHMMGAASNRTIQATWEPFSRVLLWQDELEVYRFQLSPNGGSITWLVDPLKGEDSPQTLEATRIVSF